VSRAATLRLLFAFLAGVLLAFLAVIQAAPSASAYEADLATEAEIVERGDLELPDATPHVRHRECHEVDTSGPKRPTRGVASRDPATSAVTSSSTPAGPAHQLPRRSRNTLPAVLQVFRC
jgi:hypothetical protein